jgi:hypothetical protein
VNTACAACAALLFVASQSAAQAGAALSDRLPGLHEVQVIRFEADFAARSLPSTQHHVTLARQGSSGTFSGTAQLAVFGPPYGEHRSKTVPLGPLPPEVVRRFLETLATVPVREGRYSPVFMMDVSADLTITLELGDGGLLQLQSAADDGQTHWRVTIIQNGRLFAGVTDSEIVAQAFRMLADHTGRAELRALERQ